MANVITGIQGINGPDRLIEPAEINQATPEQRSGNAADPRHARFGEQASPYPWQSSMMASRDGSHGPYGLENSLLDDEYWFSVAGGEKVQDTTVDNTPYRTHGGPSPKGLLSGPTPGVRPDDVAFARVQSMEIHGINTNAGIRRLNPPDAMGIQNDQWTDFWEASNPGETLLQPLNSRQQMSSHFMFGSRDRTQTFARQNQYGFDTAHMHRRWATGSIPGNTYWMRPGGRPLVKNIPTVAKLPIGGDSPFAGDNPMANYDPYGAVLMTQPTAYTAPSQPRIDSAPQYSAPGEVEWY